MNKIIRGSRSSEGRREREDKGTDTSDDFFLFFNFEDVLNEINFSSDLHENIKIISLLNREFFERSLMLMNFSDTIKMVKIKSLAEIHLIDSEYKI